MGEQGQIHDFVKGCSNQGDCHENLAIKITNCNHSDLMVHAFKYKENLFQKSSQLFTLIYYFGLSKMEFGLIKWSDTIININY